MNESAKVIELKPAPGMQALYLATGVGSLLFALAALAPLSETEDIKEMIPLLAGIGFFGVAGVLLLRFTLRDAGTIAIERDGFALDAYFATGKVNWDNLEEVGVARVLGFKYLGIAVRDVDRFIATRKAAKFRHASDEGAVMGALKIAFAARKFTAMDAMCSVLGWAKLPDRLDAKSMMEFNKASFGHHLMLQAMWLGDVDGLVRAIESARPPASIAPAVSKPADFGNAREFETPSLASESHRPAMKQCPMCAEDVRAEARICRFCRHTFDTDRAAA